MQVLLGSGGFGTEARREFLRGEMSAFFQEVREVLFIPYALHDHEAYTESMRKLGFDAGGRLCGIESKPDPVQAVEEAEAIFVGGGNTFRLTYDLYRLDLMDRIRAKALGGMPYMGVSAGTNIACPTMQTTNDMSIVRPASFRALGLIPLQVNTHYYPGQIWIQTEEGFEEHFGETRRDRIREFHEMNATPVLGLHEGTLLRGDGDSLFLKGADALLFVPGQQETLVSRGLDLLKVLPS